MNTHISNMSFMWGINFSVKENNLKQKKKLKENISKEATYQETE